MTCHFWNFSANCRGKASRVKSWCRGEQKLFVNSLFPAIYFYAEDCETYDNASVALKRVHTKRKMDIFLDIYLRLGSNKQHKVFNKFSKLLKCFRKIGNFCVAFLWAQFSICSFSFLWNKWWFSSFTWTIFRQSDRFWSELEMYVKV